MPGDDGWEYGVSRIDFSNSRNHFKHAFSASRRVLAEMADYVLRAQIQFIAASSMVGAGPRWADQLNSSNEATRATPQTTTMFSASTLSRVPDVRQTVLAIAAICDLRFQPPASRLA
jgi:hypothetical protein